MNITSLGAKDVELLVARYGRKIKSEIEIINKLVPYLDEVLNSEFSRVVIQEDANRCADLMEKSYSVDLTIDEKAELRYIKGRLERLANNFHVMRATEASLISKKAEV